MLNSIFFFTDIRKGSLGKVNRAIVLHFYDVKKRKVLKGELFLENFFKENYESVITGEKKSQDFQILFS